jgi:hypothetical protein
VLANRSKALFRFLHRKLQFFL